MFFLSALISWNSLIKRYLINCLVSWNIVYTQRQNTYTPHLFWIPFPFRSPKRAKQRSLCCMAGSHQLPIMCVCLCVSVSVTVQEVLTSYLWYVCVSVSVTQSCLTLCDRMDCSPPGSSVHGILQARMLECVAMPFSRGSTWPRDWTQASFIAGRWFTSWAIREAPSIIHIVLVVCVCQSQSPFLHQCSE